MSETCSTLDTPCSTHDTPLPSPNVPAKPSNANHRPPTPGPPAFWARGSQLPVAPGAGNAIAAFEMNVQGP